MGPGEHRPNDDQYWARPWSTALFAGDLFEAVPFGEQPTVLYSAEDGPDERKHFVGEIALGYGLLITPTCDMVEQREGGVAHPFRTLVPVVPIPFVVEQTQAVASSENASPQPRHAPSVHVSAGASGGARAGVGRLSVPAESR